MLHHPFKRQVGDGHFIVVQDLLYLLDPVESRLSIQPGHILWRNIFPPPNADQTVCSNVCLARCIITAHTDNAVFVAFG